jgi:hypothetical protein
MDNRIVSKKQLFQFGLLLGFGIPLIFGFIFPAFRGHSFKFWTIWVGSVFILFGFLNPLLLLIPYRGWMYLAHILGLINSRIILGIIFFIVLVPISVVMRIFGYDPLKKKKMTTNKNSFKEYKLGYKIDLTRIF